MKEGSIIWVTGLSGAGKSTISEAMSQKLSRDNLHVLILDGDEVRDAIRDLDCRHDYESRLKNAYRIARLARIAARQGHLVIVATMSMFHEIHQWNRNNLPYYFEVFLKVDIEILKQRDPKGLYAEFDSGTKENMPGMDIKPEFPNAPHFILENNKQSPEAIDQANHIIKAWQDFLKEQEF